MLVTWGCLIGLLSGGLCLAAFSLSLNSITGIPRAKLGQGFKLLRWRAVLIFAGFGLLGGYLSSEIRSPWLSSDMNLLAVTGVLAATALLMALAMVDLVERRLPDQLNLALLALGLTWHLATGSPISDSLLGILVGGGVTLLLAILGPLGMGDVKLSAALGALLGYSFILYGLALGVLFGGIAAIVLLISQKLDRKDYMAYGPYLAAGGWLFWIIVLL